MRILILCMLFLTLSFLGCNRNKNKTDELSATKAQRPAGNNCFSLSELADNGDQIQKGKSSKYSDFNFPDLDAKYGFRKLKFESCIDSLSGFTKTGEKKNLVVYIRKDDSLKISASEIESIAYVFYKGRFARVFIRPKGSINARILFDILEKTYGKSIDLNSLLNKMDYPFEHDWPGEKTSLKFIWENDSLAKVFISSVKMDSKIESDKKIEIDTAKIDL